MRIFLLVIFTFSVTWASVEKLDYILRKLVSKNPAVLKSDKLKYSVLGKELEMKEVKVLRSDGSVDIVSLLEKPLSEYINDESIIYIEAPKPVVLTNDVLFYRSYAVSGKGNTTFTVNDPGYGLEIYVDIDTQDQIDNFVFKDVNCLGNNGYYICSGSTSYSLEINYTGDFRVIFFGRGLQKSNISSTGNIEIITVGTGSSEANNRGSGVLVGIVDSGVNFCHPMFLDAQGNTRIKYFAYITDPITCDIEGGNLINPYFICEFDENLINSKISEGKCNYDFMGHGTHVLGTAAGRDDLFPGIASESQLIVFAFDFASETVTDTEIMKTLEWIVEKARSLGKPIVINMSIAIFIDPFDGTGLLDRKVDEISSNGVIVVAGAGNNGALPVHAYTIKTQDVIPVTVRRESNGSYILLISGWFENPSKWRVDVCNSNLSHCVGSDPGKDMSFLERIEGTNCKAAVYNSITEFPLNGDGWFFIEIECSEVSYLNIRLSQVCGDVARVDMWDVTLSGAFERALDNIVRDLFGGYMFTIVSPGTSEKAITVGAINSKSSYALDLINYTDTFFNLGHIANFSSRGPTRDGRIKPDIVAGGAYVVSANSRFLYSDKLYRIMSGTSMSTPVVTGLVALYLQLNPDATPEEVKTWLLNNAVKEHSEIEYPNVAYGYGKAYWGSNFSYSSSYSEQKMPVELGSGKGVCVEETKKEPKDDETGSLPYRDSYTVRESSRKGICALGSSFYVIIAVSSILIYAISRRKHISF